MFVTSNLDQAEAGSRIHKYLKNNHNDQTEYRRLPGEDWPVVCRKLSFYEVQEAVRVVFNWPFPNKYQNPAHAITVSLKVCGSNLTQANWKQQATDLDDNRTLHKSTTGQTLRQMHGVTTIYNQVFTILLVLLISICFTVWPAIFQLQVIWRDPESQYRYYPVTTGQYLTLLF